ncbi:hypothetical protein BH10BAC1_BH10BAC1_06060 [soil metagenome]
MNGVDGTYDDFGARMFDSRLGRWMSVDPNHDRYPGISPYNFCYNIPTIFADKDGRDGRLTIVENENGGGTITIETTIFLYGPLAQEVAKEAEVAFNKMNNTFTYIDPITLKEWKIIINTDFKVSENLGKIVGDKNPASFLDNKVFVGVDGFKDGDNIGYACLNCPIFGAKSGTIEMVYGPANFIAANVFDGENAVHVLGHFLGTGDSYLSGINAVNEYYKHDWSSGQGKKRIYDTHYIAIAQKYIDSDFNGGLKTDADGVKLQFNQTPMMRVIPGMSWNINKVKSEVKQQRDLRTPAGDGGANDPKANNDRGQA